VYVCVYVCVCVCMCVCQVHLEIILKHSWTDCIERMEEDRPALQAYRKKKPR